MSASAPAGRSPRSLRSPGQRTLEPKIRKPRREVSFLIRLTRAEREDLAARADEAKVPLATYLRRSALGRRPTPVIEANVSLLHELSRVGNNLNQVARYCNIREGEEPSIGEIAKVITDLLDVIKAIGSDLQEPRS